MHLQLGQYLLGGVVVRLSGDGGPWLAPTEGNWFNGTQYLTFDVIAEVKVEDFRVEPSQTIRASPSEAAAVLESLAPLNAPSSGLGIWLAIAMASFTLTVPVVSTALVPTPRPDAGENSGGIHVGGPAGGADHPGQY